MRYGLPAKMSKSDEKLRIENVVKTVLHVGGHQNSNAKESLTNMK